MPAKTVSQTLYDKLYSEHLVATREDGQDLLYIDLHLVHEVTSPQAFSVLKNRNIELWNKGSIFATPDHNVSTKLEERFDPQAMTEHSRLQVERLRDNAKDYDLRLFDLDDVRQGIVHVIGPELGATLPGTTVVCGDSHTSTHGALASLAMGIGTSQVAHVLATNCIMSKKLKNMRARFTGTLPKGVCAKDLVLRLIAEIGAGGGTGYALELCGPVIEDLSMEGRMTMCNMGIEAGARVTLVGYDQITEDYVLGRQFAPSGEQLPQAREQWRLCRSDADAEFDREITIDVSDMAPYVTWGTSPDHCISVDGEIPVAQGDDNLVNACEYMGLEPGQKLTDVAIDKIFIGSCTNSRIEDLREAANVLLNRKVSASVKEVLVVPGSGLVKQQAEKEGLDQTFINAGAQWREAGCSMCLAMNNDRLEPQERCASTSNRNFEGRQGYGGRTHLLSPAMAAAAAVTGKITDVRDLL